MITGGIVGILLYGGRIENCYNRGNVKAVYEYNGGILGAVAHATTSSQILSNCYNTGNISGEASGSIIGTATKYVTIKNTYWISSNSCYATVANGIPIIENVSKLTQADLTTADAILGGEYTQDISDKNEGYPILKWQMP